MTLNKLLAPGNRRLNAGDYRTIKSPPGDFNSPSPICAPRTTYPHYNTTQTPRAITSYIQSTAQNVNSG